MLRGWRHNEVLHDDQHFFESSFGRCVTSGYVESNFLVLRIGLCFQVVVGIKAIAPSTIHRGYALCRPSQHVNGSDKLFAKCINRLYSVHSIYFMVIFEYST
jgi:hypothetical protein